jgi:hypothetical protein
VCTCGGGGNWNCIATPTCPTNQPNNGDTCQAGTAFLTCAYGDTACNCRAGQWSCVTCPATQPAGSSDCAGSEGAVCDYSGTNCFCRPATSTWACF